MSNLRTGIFFLTALGVIGWAESAQPIRVACIGNSITAGGYPEKLAPLLGPSYKVENDGVSGCTLLRKGDKPYWTQGKLSNVFAFKPHIITIKLGTNDTKPQNWDKYGGDFAKDLNALIDTLNTISTKPQIWLTIPIPIFQNTFNIRGDTLKTRIIPIIKQVAAARGLNLIDANTPLVNHQELYRDGVHVQPAGNDSIAAIFYRAFEAKSIKIACIGNSITQYVNTVSGTTLPEEAYAAQLGMLYGRGHFVQNHGVSGAYTQKDSPFPYWNTGRIGQIIAWKPQHITIKLGTNDSRVQYWNREKYIKDLTSMIDTLSKISPTPKIWLTLPVPAWKRNGLDPFNGISGTMIRDQVIPAIKQVANAKGLSTIDAYTPFLALERLVPDGVHPIAEGQDTLANVFYRTMTAIPTSLARKDYHPENPGIQTSRQTIFGVRVPWLSGIWGVDGRSRSNDSRL